MSGYETVSVTIDAALSINEGDGHAAGTRVWDELKAELRKLVDDPRFASILPEIHYEN